MNQNEKRGVNFLKKYIKSIYDFCNNLIECYKNLQWKEYVKKKHKNNFSPDLVFLSSSS